MPKSSPNPQLWKSRLWKLPNNIFISKSRTGSYIKSAEARFSRAFYVYVGTGSGIPSFSADVVSRKAKKKAGLMSGANRFDFFDFTKKKKM